MSSTTAVANGSTSTELEELTAGIESEVDGGIIVMPSHVPVHLVGPNTNATLKAIGALSKNTDKKGNPKPQRAWYRFEANKVKLADGLDIRFAVVDDNGVVEATAGEPTLTQPRARKRNGRTVMEGGGNPVRHHSANVVIHGQRYQMLATVSNVRKHADADGTPRYFISARLFKANEGKGPRVNGEFEGQGIEL